MDNQEGGIWRMFARRSQRGHLSQGSNLSFSLSGRACYLYTTEDQAAPARVSPGATLLLLLPPSIKKGGCGSTRLSMSRAW